MTIRAVCFDLDGTLLRDDHIDAVVRRVAADVARRHPGVDGDALAEANLAVWIDYWPEVGEDWLAGRVPMDAVPREVWRRALLRFGVDDADTIETALELHRTFESEAFTLYPEVREVMAELRERGIRLAIITNGPSGLQRSKIDATSLDSEFDAIVVSGEHGVEKPEEEIFRIALALLGVEAGEALHVGDNQVADVAGARRAGLTAVWVDRRGAQRDSEPHAVMPDLRGLLDLV